VLQINGCLRPASTAQRNEKTAGRTRLYLLASPTAGPSTTTRHTLLSSLLCLARQQRRQPLALPALTDWPR